MDHEMEGQDYATDAFGHRIAKSAAPATVDLPEDYNSVWRNGMEAILRSGVGLAANAAAAAAEGWTRLWLAINRIANKTSIVTPEVQVTSASISLNPALDTHGYRITESASFPNARITLDSGVTHDGRYLLLQNTTGTTKYVIGNADSITAILPGRTKVFHARNLAGSVSWQPLDQGDTKIVATDYTINTTPQTITPDGKVLRLTGTQAAGSVVTLAENDNAFPGQVILVINDNSNLLLVGPQGVPIESGSGSFFYYNPALTTGTKWVQVRPRTTGEIIEAGDLYFTDARARSALASVFPLAHSSQTAGANITPPTANVMLRLGGSYGPGNITLAENDGNYADHLLFVENDGTEINFIGSANHRVRVEPGRMAIFKYDANRATDAKWVPIMIPNNTDSVPEGSGNLFYTNGRADARIAAALASSSFSGEYRATNGASTESLGSGTFNYKATNGVVFLSIPELASFTVAMADHGTGGNTINLRITGASEGQIPSAVRMTPANTNGALVQVIVAGVAEIWMLRLSGGDAGWLALWRLNNVNVDELDTLTVMIPAQTVVWANF